MRARSGRVAAGAGGIRRGVDRRPVLARAVIGHHLGLLEPRRALRRGDRVLEVADLVDEPERQRLTGGVDAAVGERAYPGLVELARAGDQLDEPPVEPVDQVLEERPLLRPEAPERAAHVLELAGLHVGRADADLLEEPARVDRQHQDSDGAGHRRGVDEDPVGRERHVVAARGADVEDGRHHGHLAARLEPHDLVVQDVRRGDRASGAVDPEDDRAHPIVVLGLLELLADAREERDLRPALEGEDGLLREDPGEVDEQDLVGAAAIDRALLERADARRQVDRHDAAARERQEGQREADETVAHDLAGRVYPPSAGRCRGCCDGSRPPRAGAPEAGLRTGPARPQVSRPCEERPPRRSAAR